ncbi:helix-turn-helix transcriptional regulator [Nocardia uniformis]|uniref:Helix-turn-helix transcriptional regulator n=1 Tax=Nocardia uniformis TaxID=53432 RepID=A0A849C3U4_9NOCA|nr:helix-turn-helix domain-containing protein [Nocardia uniformis]NNH73383.1 helix-turn-helix transcriptional regulator [Nocardia uniformis]
MAEPVPPREITDPAALRALAHPLRQRILRALAEQGPSTSTALGALLGENTGATSYHLRQLAEHGFIEEAPELAKGKERWWRSPPQDLRYRVDRASSPELRELMEGLLAVHIADDVEAFQRFEAERAELGEWADMVPFSRGAIHATREELEAFFEDYLTLLKRFQSTHAEGRPGTRRVLTRFIAFPAPGMNSSE